MEEIFKEVGINIEISKIEKGIFNDGAGNTVFINITNQTSKRMKIEVDEFFIVTKNSAQFEKNAWLNGFSLNSASVISNAYKIAGGIFMESVCGKVTDYDKIGITVNDLTNGVLYECLFKVKTANKYLLLHCNVKEIEKTPDIKRTKTRLKKCIERIEVFEEKLGLSLSNISVNVSSDFRIAIFGEVMTLDGLDLAQSIYINAILYNSEGEIIDKSAISFYKGKFMGFETFEINFYEDNIALEIDRIRLYVTKN